MQKEDDYHYPREPPPLPQYDISPELKKLVLMFMGAMLINFLIAGSLAIGMRIIQTDVPVIKVDGISQNVLFYALLTAHGQVMFFGVISANTMWFGFYALSKWGRKPLAGMKWAKTSFWIMEGSSHTNIHSRVIGIRGRLVQSNAFNLSTRTSCCHVGSRRQLLRSLSQTPL